MRTPTKSSLISSHVRLDAAVLLALPFPACIYDPGSNMVFHSNSFFNQENSVSLLSLLEKWDYNFLTGNDIKILNHRIKLENKLTTRRVFQKENQLKSVEINITTIPGQSLALFFFTEVWTQETVFSKTVHIAELVQSISEGIVLVDDNNMITFCNGSFAAFFGKNEDDVIASNILSIMDYSNSSILCLEIENLHQSEGSNFELQLKTPDNKEQYVLVNAIPRKANDGKYCGAIFTLVDIIERVIIERELIIAKDKALDADRLKSTFLANMSHEIRTPMNCILGFSSMLKRSGLDRKKRDQFIDIINTRGKHLMDILNNIIDISKIEENLIQLNIEECNLDCLFEELNLFYQEELIANNKRQVNLIFNRGFRSENFSIRTDGARLRQVLSNLLNNAIKFTESGSIEIGFYEDNFNSLVFYVKDTGIGITPDKYNLIFDRFRQVDESFTRSYGGTGLGLSICKGLLKLMGGKIWVESDGINGSSFFFSIPYYKLDEGLIKMEDIMSIDGVKYDWSGRKILIIEDDPTSFEFLSEVLMPTQCTVQHANNGIDALKWFGMEPFDLVLLDIQLPEMDGYQIANSIRLKNPHIPIIAQTAHAMSDDKQKCFNAGCNEYITKPVQFERLLETINTFFLS